MNAAPFPVIGRQISPGRPGSQYPKHRINKTPVILSDSSPLAALSRQMGFQQRPHVIAYVMSVIGCFHLFFSYLFMMLPFYHYPLTLCRRYLIQRPPIVEHPAVAVSFLGKVWIGSHLFAAHPLQPSLTLAIFGILDVIACAQEGLALKIPVHIAPVRTIACGLDDSKQTVGLLLPFSAAVPPSGPTLAAWRFLRILQERGKLLA